MLNISATGYCISFLRFAAATIGIHLDQLIILITLLRDGQAQGRYAFWPH